jgi:hypothetical protein
MSLPSDRLVLTALAVPENGAATPLQQQGSRQYLSTPSQEQEALP